ATRRREHREICALSVSKSILRREAGKALRSNSASDDSSRVFKPPQILRFRRPPSPLRMNWLREHREICALSVSKSILRREAPKDLRSNSSSDDSSRVFKPPQILRFRRPPSPLRMNWLREHREICALSVSKSILRP